MNSSTIRFSNMKDPEFINELRIRVNDYFEKRKISKFGNGRMVVKSVVMLSMYFVPYFFILFSGLSNVWGMFALWITMGFGMAGIGMSVMHDANHGSYFNNPKINNFIGHIIFFIGGSSLTWKIQHNHLHHAFTNVQGADKDLETVKFLRFSPHQKRKKIHRLQFIYAWFFYGLMTLSRYFITDYKQIFMFKKMGLTNRQKQSFGTLFSLLVFTKVFYAILILGLPMMLSGVLWWQTVLFFLSMHFVSGFILGIVFQPAHVMPDTKFPLPNEDGNLDNNWGIHQLLTTTNFGPKSNIFSWFVGGLNFQIEHHLFPGISHVHYKKISKLVKGTALEYGLPYNSQPNFIMALWNHEKMLFNLGKASYRANV